ncbi:cytochrome b [Methylobacterium sp. CM6247]
MKKVPAMTASPHRFTVIARALHWTMAPMILAMLLIGLWLAGTVSPSYDLFLRIHRPLGVAVLVLAVLRLGYRLTHRPPSLPTSLPAVQKFGARASHLALYTLMIAMPLVGWAMLSAAQIPIVLYGPLQLPPIVPHSLSLYAVLRKAHTFLAYLLIATFLLHLAAALFHRLIRRDGVFESMASLGNTREPERS